MNVQTDEKGTQASPLTTAFSAGRDSVNDADDAMPAGGPGGTASAIASTLTRSRPPYAPDSRPGQQTWCLREHHQEDGSTGTVS